jgi:hypothetical protein
MATCNGKLVFIDIDNTTGLLYTSTDGGVTWPSTALTSAPCPGAGVPLVPRDSGFTLGVTVSPSAPGDRLLIIGGDDLDTDVWISDDCGLTWTCLDPPEEWTPRDFSVVVTAPPNAGFPAGTLFMGGGVTQGLLSIGMFQTLDGGATWTRPSCDPASCQFPYDDGQTYLFPDDPTVPGMITSDGTTLYWIDDLGDPTFYLNSSNYNIGWLELGGTVNTENMFGRKVWIGSTDPATYPTAGCWFSTDYDSDALWVVEFEDVESMNQFSTASSVNGPWTLSPVAAPWAPRASAVVLPLGSSVLVAGGMSFVSNAPAFPTFGDVWSVDAGVCLLDSSGNVCSGKGVPDLARVGCECDLGYQEPLCGSCIPFITYGPSCLLCPVAASGGGSCNAAGGGGTCDSVQGCVCNAGWGGAACDQCLPNFAGASCAPCAPCSPLGGICNGNGTTSGTGKCVCKTGWTGSTCSVPPPPAPPSSDGNAAGSGGVGPGGAAGISIFVIGAAGFAGLVFAYGGVGQAATAVKGFASKGVSKVGSLVSGAAGGGGGSYARVGGGGGAFSAAGTGGGSSSSGPSSVLKLSPEKAAARLLVGKPAGGGYGAV